MGFSAPIAGLTPNLDALARQSVVFTRAYAQVPLTTPSHATMLTGTYPQCNHVEDLGTPLAPRICPTCPICCASTAITRRRSLGRRFSSCTLAPGFDRGFDFYDGHFHQREPGRGSLQKHRAPRRGCGQSRHGMAEPAPAGAVFHLAALLRSARSLRSARAFQESLRRRAV